jgi:hypothetical protein
VPYWWVPVVAAAADVSRDIHSPERSLTNQSVKKVNVWLLASGIHLLNYAALVNLGYTMPPSRWTALYQDFPVAKTGSAFWKYWVWFPAGHYVITHILHVSNKPFIPLGSTTSFDWKWESFFVGCLVIAPLFSFSCLNRLKSIFFTTICIHFFALFALGNLVTEDNLKKLY